MFFIGYCFASSQPANPLTHDEKYLVTVDHIPIPNYGIANGIIRDDRGFLWFGTTKGLCRYDGYQVKILVHESPFVSNIGVCIRWSSDSLLLGTDKGLWIFDIRSEQFASFFDGKELSGYRINSLVEDSDGTIWIGTESQGIFSYNRASRVTRHVTTASGLSENNITSLLLDHAGIVWIGTVGGGLIAFDRRTSHFVHYRADVSQQNTLLSNHVTALCENDNHELWIGTDRGLNVLDPARTHMRRLNLPSPIQHTIWSIAQDPAGRMWIGAPDIGLVSYVHGMFTLFPASKDIARSLSTIRVLYPDPVASSPSDMILWIGTRNGIDKVFLSTSPFTNHIRNQDSLQLDRGAVLSLCEDRNGILWAGLWGGGLEALRRVNGRYKRIAHFENDPKDPSTLPNNDVGTVLEDHNGELWIGTAAGLAKLDSQRRKIEIFKHVEEDSTSLISNEINMVYMDRSGEVWVCTDKGLSRLVRGNPNHFKNYLHDPADTHPTGAKKVSYIYQDHLSNLWVATYGRGLNRLEANGTFTRFIHHGSSFGYQENWIYNLTEDQEGLLWLSMGEGMGLVSFDPLTGNFRRYTIDRLHDAHIFGIAEDQKGNLWLSTGIGLAMYNPKTQTFVKYDEKNGMPFKEFFSGFFRNRQGRLFIGGIDGFTEFFPESVLTSSRPPVIAITSFSVFDKESSTGGFSAGDIHLPYDQNFLSFSFAALDYADPTRNRFSYRMIGVDKGWVDAGTRNYASYSNLDPGEYMFEVKGCNSDNVWNEAGTSIAIIITPPYWQTWWFRMFIATLIAGTTYAAYKYRLKKLLEVERLRLRIADDLHDDVGSNLGTIAMVSRAVQRAPELSSATKRKLEEIYDTAITTSEGMKDIVWFIKPKNDTLDDLVLRMKDAASSLLVNIEHDFRAPDDRSSTRVGIDFKRNFFLAFKEILTNIVKHSSATKVQIRVEQRDGMLETIIQDNGQGFDLTVSAKGRSGNGLSSLQSRARAIHGVFEVMSELGTGTTVKFSGRL